MNRVRLLLSFVLVTLFVCPFVGQADPDDNRYIEFEHRITGDALSGVLPFQNGMFLQYGFADDRCVYLLSVGGELYFMDERSVDHGPRWAILQTIHSAFLNDSQIMGSLIKVVDLDDQKIRLDTHQQVSFEITNLEDVGLSLTVRKFKEHSVKYEEVHPDEFNRGGFGLFEFSNQDGLSYRISLGASSADLDEDYKNFRNLLKLYLEDIMGDSERPTLFEWIHKNPQLHQKPIVEQILLRESAEQNEIRVVLNTEITLQNVEVLDFELQVRAKSLKWKLLPEVDDIPFIFSLDLGRMKLFDLSDEKLVDAEDLHFETGFAAFDLLRNLRPKLKIPERMIPRIIPLPANHISPSRGPEKISIKHLVLHDELSQPHGFFLINNRAFWFLKNKLWMLAVPDFDPVNGVELDFNLEQVYNFPPRVKTELENSLKIQTHRIAASMLQHMNWEDLIKQHIPTNDTAAIQSGMTPYFNVDQFKEHLQSSLRLSGFRLNSTRVQQLTDLIIQKISELILDVVRKLSDAYLIEVPMGAGRMIEFDSGIVIETRIFGQYVSLMLDGGIANNPKHPAPFQPATIYKEGLGAIFLSKDYEAPTIVHYGMYTGTSRNNRASLANSSLVLGGTELLSKLFQFSPDSYLLMSLGIYNLVNREPENLSPKLANFDMNRSAVDFIYTLYPQLYDLFITENPSMRTSVTEDALWKFAVEKIKQGVKLDDTIAKMVLQSRHIKPGLIEFIKAGKFANGEHLWVFDQLIQPVADQRPPLNSPDC